MATSIPAERASPPRLTGDAQKDIEAISEWMKEVAQIANAAKSQLDDHETRLTALE